MKHTLKDSHIYDLLGLDAVITNIATKINPKIDEFRLSEPQYNAVLSDIKYKAHGYGKDKIVSRIESGKIIFVLAPSIPLPAWCMQVNGQVVAVCNLFGKTRLNRDGGLSYQIKEVFGLAVVAYVLRSFYVNETKYLYSNQLIVNTGVVYTRMIMRVMDSMFSVNAIGNDRESALVEYLIVKFYLRRIMEKSSSSQQETSNIGSIMARTRKVTNVPMSAYIADAETFPDEAFESIDSLCKALAASIPTLSRLETNLLIRKLIVMLGEKAALMLESPHYLLAYTVSSAYNTNLIKDFQMSEIAGQQVLSKIAGDVFNLDAE